MLPMYDQSLSLQPLVSLNEGQHAKLLQINGGHHLVRRLISLGLRVGAELDVLQRRHRGVVVASAGTRVALGQGIAEKLMVKPLN